MLSKTLYCTKSHRPLSCLFLSIKSLEWTKTHCNAWVGFGSRSLSAILSLLRWTHLPSEELASLSQTCCSIGNSHHYNDNFCCTKQNKTSSSLFVSISLDSRHFACKLVWHHQQWCVCCSPDQPSTVVSIRVSTNWSRDTEEHQFCESVPDLGPAWGCSVLCHILGVAVVPRRTRWQTLVNSLLAWPHLATEQQKASNL